MSFFFVFEFWRGITRSDLSWSLLEFYYFVSIALSSEHGTQVGPMAFVKSDKSDKLQLLRWNQTTKFCQQVFQVS